MTLVEYYNYFLPSDYYKKFIYILVGLILLIKFWNYYMLYSLNIPNISCMKRNMICKRIPNKTLRILSYNVFLRPPLISHEHSDFKVERTKLICKKFQDFDIILLQEVHSCLNFRCNDLIKEAQQYGIYYYYFTQGPSILSKHISNNALLILSRYPILSNDYISYNNFNSFDGIIEKGCNYSKIQLSPLYHIHIFNTHLQSSFKKNDTESSNNRTKQLKQLQQFIETKIKEGDPIIIGGDFNVDAFDVNQKKNLYNHMHPYTDVFIDSKDHTIEVPYDKNGIENNNITSICQVCKQKLKQDTSNILEKQRLDYIFYDKKNTKFKLKSFDILPFLINNQKFTQLSDHYGITATFSIN